MNAMREAGSSPNLTCVRSCEAQASRVPPSHIPPLKNLRHGPRPSAFRGLMRRMLAGMPPGRSWAARPGVERGGAGVCETAGACGSGSGDAEAGVGA
ncbi:hypothetical protein PI124_g20010 [Phytophthora idaei]|nr:hypothetical protein PI125_g18761 [Phytophthora idaei]KAG3137606.1 hypothetical protein PI126_g17316 [Phytophthora idaei]KAG3234942.1 hypothetical protein PI124_g20010 [Phytophthora idaei]